MVELVVSVELIKCSFVLWCVALVSVGKNNNGRDKKKKHIHRHKQVVNFPLPSFRQEYFRKIT